jgi:hypothetical protein
MSLDPSILERPLIEASVVASYLMTSDPSVIEDYRKCSYKDRLRSPWSAAKPGFLADKAANQSFPDFATCCHQVARVKRSETRGGLTIVPGFRFASSGLRAALHPGYEPA